MTRLRTMCPMNCHPTLCGMLVDVEDGRLVGVRATPTTPTAAGFLCIRGQASREIIGNPPACSIRWSAPRRGSDDWRRGTWEEALDLIVDAHARGRAATRSGHWSGHGLFANNYGTRVGLAPAPPLRQPLRRAVVEPHDDLLGTRRLRSRPHRRRWRRTPRRTWAPTRSSSSCGAPTSPRQPNTARHLAAARRRGAHVVTIDVRETEAAAQSDETLLVRPGTRRRAGARR